MIVRFYGFTKSLCHVMSHYFSTFQSALDSSESLVDAEKQTRRRLLLKAWERAKQKGGEFHQRAKNQYRTRAMFLNVDPSILYAHSGKSRCIRHSYL